MEVQRNKEQRTKHGTDCEEVAKVGWEHARGKDDVAGCEWVRSDADLDEHEKTEESGRYGDWYDGGKLGPAAVRANIYADEEGYDGSDEGEGAEEVDSTDLGEPVVGWWAGKIEVEVDGGEGYQAQRSLTDECPGRGYG